MKTVLYATDRSVHSAKTLNYAYALTDQLGAQLKVLHIYPLSPLALTGIPMDEQQKKRVFMEQLQLLREYCTQNLPSSKTPPIWSADVVANGRVVDGILMKAGELHADLVLVGMKDEQSERGPFAGNIAHALLERSPCPLLLIPNAHTYRKPSSLVYATAFEMDDLKAIRQLVPLAKATKAFIHVIHVPVPGEYPGEEQMAWFRELLSKEVDYKKIDFQVLQEGKVKDGIAGFVDRADADLLVMLERKEKGLLKGIFHKDLVKVMEGRLELPILAFVGD